VSGMLPKNRLRKERLSRLKTFEGRGHPYDENILKVENGGGQSILDHEDVKKTMRERHGETAQSPEM
jgi:large subunit ribosomal protein L13